jgi:Holliday junction resolvasome RuvABC ATP-dependent DNA helicase subunit
VAENNNYNRNNKTTLNPFSPQYPADPEYFSNRRQHLAYFTQAIINSAKIRPPAPSNFIVLGDWGIGKTSLIYKMKEVVLKDLQSEVNGFCFHFSLDPICCKSWDNFALLFLTQLHRNYETSAGLKEKVVKELSKYKISFSVPGIPIAIEKTNNKKDAETLFLTDSLEELWKNHLVPAKVDVAVLFIDDIHYFLLVDQPDAYYTLRNVFQELARRGCNYSLVVTGHKLLFKEVSDIAEPFTRFFHQFALESFTLEGTKEAINKRILARDLKIDFSNETISLIHEKAKGHPYFIMFIVYELINRLKYKEHIVRKDFEDSWMDIMELLEKNVFVNRLGELSEKEKEVLLQIVKIDKEQITPSDVKGISGVAQFFLRIERKGLLVKKERGCYELFHPLFKEYLQRATR